MLFLVLCLLAEACSRLKFAVFNWYLIVSGKGLLNRTDHGFFSGMQMVAQRTCGIKIAAAKQGAEDGHMFINGDDIALLQVTFIPLIMKMEDNGYDFK